MAMKAGRLSLSVITRGFAKRASEKVARTSHLSNFEHYIRLDMNFVQLILQSCATELEDIL